VVKKSATDRENYQQNRGKSELSHIQYCVVYNNVKTN